MRNYFNFLIKSEFNKNVFSLFKGNLLAQLIGIIGAIVLAKLYGNESYGLYNVFLSLTGVFTILFTLNLEQTIVITKNKKESNTIFNSLFYITLLICIIFILIFTILFNLNSFTNYYWILILSSIGALILANKNIFEMFFTRIKYFKIQSQSRVLIALLTIIFQGGLFFFFPIKGLIFGSLVAALILLLYLISFSKDYLYKPSFSYFLKTIKNYADFIKYGLTSNFINSVANNILPILIASFFSLASTGVYALSLKIVLTPMLLISSSITQVYFQKANEIVKDSFQELYLFTKKIVTFNFILMVGILLIINTIGLFLLKLVFSKGWENIEFYILTLSFYVICRVTFSPVSYLITILNKLQIGLVFNLYLVLINFIAIYLGYHFQDLRITVLVFSFFGGIGYLILLKYFFSLLKKTIK